MRGRQPCGPFRLATLAALVFFFPLAGNPPQASAEHDHLLCYKAKQSKGFPRFGKTDATKKLYAALGDVLDANNPQGIDPSSVTGVATNVQIKKVKDLCTPAAIDGEPISDPDGLLGTHYVMYQIKAQKGRCSGDHAIPCKKNDDCIESGTSGPCDPLDKFDKRAPANQSTRVRDAYVDLRLDFAKEAMVLVPATADPNAFDGIPGGDHFKCYSVKPTKKLCAADAPSNAFEACKKEVDCGGTKKVTSFCEKAPKFPKETHPDGIHASVGDIVSTQQDPADPVTTLELRKLKMFCQAADKKLAGSPLETRAAEQSGLLCYQIKAAKKKCRIGSAANELAPCRKEIDCGGVKRVTDFCSELDPKFDKKDPSVQALFVEDQLFEHRLDAAKQDMLCTKACRGFEDFLSSGLAAHVSSLGIETTPDVGVNVDGLTTCRPTGCTPALGVDNALAGLGALVNALLQEQLDSQGINLLFEADALAAVPSYTATISGFTGELATAAGCNAGDPNNLPIDPADPNDPCNYVVSTSVDFGGTCREGGLVSIPVTVTGADTTPTAIASGGGPGADFTFSLPFGDTPISITAQNVVVDAEITHDGTSIATIGGHLGGGVDHQTLVDTIAGLDNTCQGGPSDGDPCDPNAPDCGGSPCALISTFTSGALADFVALAFPPDLDLDGTPGAESVSINLAFSAERAVISGAE